MKLPPFPPILGSLPGGQSVLAWAVALGGAYAWHSYSRQAEVAAVGKQVFSDAEREAWNAERKAKTVGADGAAGAGAGGSTPSGALK